MSEVTGGGVRVAVSMRTLMSHMEEIANTQASQPGVIINFEVIKSVVNTARIVTFAGPHTLVHTQPNQQVGFWPIPEAYLPSNNVPSLQIRFAHPTIHLVETPVDYLSILQNNKFPCFDTFEIDSKTPLYQYLVGSVNTYLCYIQGSKGVPASYGDSFGFVKKVIMNDDKIRVFMYLLPYNFPRFFTFFDEIKATKTASQAWKNNFEKYLRDIPPYYVAPLRSHWKRYNLPPIFPDTADIQLYNIESHLKRLKKAEKAENETNVNVKRVAAPVIASTMEAAVEHDVQEVEQDANGSKLVQEVVVNKNPFDIDRSSLLIQLNNMSFHLFGTSRDMMNMIPSSNNNSSQQSINEQVNNISKQEIAKHSVPISQMGNFEQVLNKKQTLRDPLSDPYSTPHRFGSPFQKKKKRRSSRSSTPTSDMLKDHNEKNIVDESSNSGQQGLNANEKVTKSESSDNEVFLGDEMDIIERQELHFFNNQQPSSVDSNVSGPRQDLVVNDSGLVHVDNASPISSSSTFQSVDSESTVNTVPEENVSLIVSNGPDVSVAPDVEQSGITTGQDLVVNTRVPVERKTPSKLVQNCINCVKEMVMVNHAPVHQLVNAPENVLVHMYQRSCELKSPRRDMAQLHRMIRSSGISSLGKRKRQGEDEEIASVMGMLDEMEFLNANVEKKYVERLISTAVEFKKKKLTDKLKEYSLTLL
ncbi:ints6 [Acrasis kona]|uniref:Ints6 n=1 Tax=Acrasis kona TaxID=1008807 RepID=A0AAW2YT27_9EUKA